MKKHLKFLVCFAIVFGGLLLANSSNVEAKTVYISKTSFSLNYKQTYTLKLNNAASSSVKWSSSNTSIAKVSSKGVVTALSKKGTSTITASYGGQSYKCKVYVFKNKLCYSSLNIGIGSTNTVKVRTSIKSTAKWTSSDKKVATVSSTGRITGVKAGTCTITATIDKKKYTCAITVLAKKAKITITPDTQPYNGKYMMDTESENYYYSDKTRNTYTLRSYMSKFEKEGGGTIVLTKGTYTLVKSVNVPSNVTIELKDGATIKKSWDTGSKNLTYQNAMFFVVPPTIVQNVAAQQAIPSYYEKYESTWTYPAAVKGYNGSKNVVFKGAKGGKSVIDNNKLFFTLGISVGHCNGLTIQDLKFKNMDGNHFIELNSSKNVLVQRCTFEDDYTTTDYNKGNAVNGYTHKVNDKECINIDDCDPNYAGYSNPWAYHDYTPCNGVEIKDCEFTNFIRGVGGHKYTAKYSSSTKKWNSQVYNTNIKIHDNKFTKAGANAIEACNWSNVYVYNNTFDQCYNELQDHKNHTDEVNPGKKSLNIAASSALKLQCMISIFGGYNFNIYDNTFSNCRVAVGVFNVINTGGGSKYEPSYFGKIGSNTSFESNYKDNLKKIMTRNKYSNISSGCNWFILEDLYQKNPVNGKQCTYTGTKARYVAGNKTYHDCEANIDWTAILKAYKKTYFTVSTSSVGESDSENTSLVDTTAVDQEQVTTETATETTEEIFATDTDEIVKSAETTEESVDVKE
jgi:hypothetical protein